MVQPTLKVSSGIAMAFRQEIDPKGGQSAQHGAVDVTGRNEITLALRDSPVDNRVYVRTSVRV